MAGLLIPPQLQFVDLDGAPFNGGLLYAYVPGTTTQKPWFLDAGETIFQKNPAVLDARGACTVYGDGDYRMILTDAAGDQIFDLLSSEPLPASAISAAMLPVVGALTLQQARDLMGVTAAINTAISNISLLSGPTGPAGTTGVQGATGPTGPTGSAAGGNFTSITQPGGRGFGGTYTNATGKPMWVSVLGLSGNVAFAPMYLAINGAVVNQVTSQTAGGSLIGSVSGIVPSGSTYSVVAPQWASMLAWTEVV